MGCGGRGHLSAAAVLWHTWLVPAPRSAALYLRRYCGSARSTCFWLILCPHSLFCATGHTVQRSGDQIAVLAHHQAAQARRSRGRVRRFGFRRVVLAQEHKLFCFVFRVFFFSLSLSSVTFYANKTIKCSRHRVHLHPSITMRAGWKSKNSNIQMNKELFEILDGR